MTTNLDIDSKLIEKAREAGHHTTVWALAFRRKKANSDVFTHELFKIISEARARILGAIRQELLSGINHIEQYNC